MAKLGRAEVQVRPSHRPIESHAGDLGENLRKEKPVRFTMTLCVAAAALATALPAFAQSAQSAQSPSASAPTSATSPASTLATGMPVKDKTGVVIGQIADVKGDTATVKMGEQSFAIGAQSFVVQNGAAVINATQAELKQMIANAAKPG